MTETVVSSATRTVVIGFDKPFCIIGERINPTGRKKLAAEMAAGDFSTVEKDTIAQVQAGAHMLDVNAGIPLADEPAILAKTIQLVQSLTDLPDDGGRMATLWNGADAGQVALQAAYRSGALIPIHVYPTGTKVAGTDKEFFGNVRINGLEIGGGVSSAFTAEFTYKGALEYRTIPT